MLAASAGRFWASGLAAVLLLVAPAAVAHGFGQRYDLPVPLTLVVVAAGLAVAVSFALAARLRPRPVAYPRFDLLRVGIGRLLVHPAVVSIAQAVSVVLFLTTIAAGLFGTVVATDNLAPTLIWIVWWVGMALTVAALGNLWAITNPWLLLFRAAERLWRRLTRRELSRYAPYPAALSRWPAVFLFLCFAWVELAFPRASGPRELATLAILYSAITWAGMLRYGAEQWLRRGELFTVAFGYLSRLAVTELEVSEGARRRGHYRVAPSTWSGQLGGSDLDCWECFHKAPAAVRHFYLRPPGAGLLAEVERSTAGLIFVLALLATVSFDGLAETPVWERWSGWLIELIADDRAVATIGMLGSVVVLTAAYLLACMLSARLAGSSALAVARENVLALIPIAAAYHLAHYQAFLLVQGQRIIALVSDPFGFGWNLFGTAGYTIDIGVLSAELAWAIAVAAVVIGHVVSIYIAHRTAQREGRRLVSQLPLVAMMIAYTMLSLWILSQPIVS